MHSTTNKHLKALVLLSIYVFYVLTWNLHHLLEHGHHSHEVLTSNCHHSDSEQHIHGGDFLESDCSLCYFAPTVSHLSLEVWQIETQPSVDAAPLIFTVPTYAPAAAYSLAQPRGPPAIV